MKVKFWGTRGSIASPGPGTVKYGGNTTCLQVIPSDGQVLIFDGGTGIRDLGLELLKSLPVSCTIFISHTHWDHIQGLPFFVPLFIPNNSVHFYGSFDPVYGRSLQEILTGQMEYCYFPVREAELKAEINYTSLKDRETVTIGATKVTAILMNHPVLTYGYLVEADGQRMFFTGDHEPPTNIYEPDDDDYAEYEELLALKRESIEGCLADVDLLVADAMYTEAEYPSKVGWGHGTFSSCFDLARRVRAKRIAMTHHEPVRSDDQLDEIEEQLQSKRQSGDPEVLIAREGVTLDLA